jgi:hypothetical protein
LPQSSSFADDLASIRNPTPSAGSFADDLRVASTGYSVSPDVGALIGSAGAPLPKPPSPTTFEPPPPPDRNFDVNQKTGERVTPLPIGTIPVLDAPAIGIPQAARGAKNLVTDPSLGAANDVIEGLFKTAEPLMAGAAIANPLLTGQMVLRSVIASKFGEDVAGSVGASEEGKRLSGNVAALLSGGLGVKKFAEKVAADARAVAEQVRAFDAANPRPAPPETVNVGRGATPAAAAERVSTPTPAPPPESFAADLDIIRPEPPPVETVTKQAQEAPIAPVEPPPAPAVAPKFDAETRKLLRKQGVTDATIDKMEQDQRVSVAAAEPRVDVVPPTPPAGLFRPGDTIKIVGETDDKVHTIDSVGPDGWIYTKSGAAVKPEQVYRAAPTPVLSGGFDYDRQPNAATQPEIAPAETPQPRGRVASFPTREDATLSTEAELKAVLRDPSKSNIERAYAADEMEVRGLDPGAVLGYTKAATGQEPPQMPRRKTPPQPVEKPSENERFKSMAVARSDVVDYLQANPNGVTPGQVASALFGGNLQVAQGTLSALDQLRTINARGETRGGRDITVYYPKNLATQPPVVENGVASTEEAVPVFGANGLADQLNRIEDRVDRLTMRGTISESELEQIEALTDRIEQQIGTRKEIPAAEAAKMGDELKAAIQSLRPARRAQLAAATKDVNEARNLPGEPVSPAAPAASAQVDDGQVAPRGEGERPAPDESGLLASGRREGRPAQRRAVGRTIKPDASADNDTLNELVARAVAGGYRGDTNTLRTDLTERLQALRDIDSEFADSGRNPITLLKAIAKLGGISSRAETGQKGEIARLKEFRDQQSSERLTTSKTGEVKRRGRPGGIITMDSIRGVRGIFRDAGLPLDDIVARLKQDPEFDHIQTIEDLTHEIELAASDQSDALSAKRFVKGLGEKYWENVSEPVEQPAGEDVNEFGEVQPRLPEAGMVREQNIETPEFDAPFSLTAEIDKQIKERDRDLFEREPGADDEDETTLSRFMREEEGSVPLPEDLKTIAKGMRQIAGEVAAVIAPQSRSPEAQRAADIVRLAMAKAANPGTVERMKADKRYGIGPSKGAEVAFAKGGKDKAVADISSYERTGQFPAVSGLDPGYSKLYQDSQMASLILYRYAYGADQVGYIENRVARLFRFPDRANQAKGEAFLHANARKLSADRGPTKSRVLDMPLDQALAQMKARGIDVEMASWNPETIRQWDLSNARLAAAMRDAWTDLKAGGLVTWVKAGDKAPAGMVAIDEKGAKFFYPREREKAIVDPNGNRTVIVGGKYYADENVARVLNNVVSDGFGMRVTVNGIMKINNAYNQLQLGFSAFHAMGTAIHGAAADAHIAVRRLMAGAPSEAVLPALRAMVPGVSFARDIYRGAHYVNDLKRDNPAAWDALENKLNPGGVRLQMQQDYRTDMIKSMTEAWREGKYDKALVRLPLAVVEAIAKPLLDYAVPRVKIAVALDRMAEVNRRMPNATPEQKARAYAAASDQIDNKFGLLVYDNGFWKRTHRQAAHMSTRSVGWSFGTLRWGVGTAADMGQVVKNLASGKHADASDRMIDALVYPMVAAYLGAMYMYLSTGKKPKSAKDVFYPENGRTDKNGKPSRTVLPTYMKDVYAYSQDPLATILQKQSPVLESTYDLLKNEDYFGVLIADPDDPKVKQWEDRGKYILKNALPFSITQGQRIHQESGGDLAQSAEAFLGLTPASAAISRTPLERYLHSLVPPAHLNHEQAERAQARRDVRALAQGGKIAEAVQAARESGMSAASIRATLKTAREGTVRSQFERLSWNQAVKAYTLADPDERKPLRIAVDRKVGAAMAAASDKAERDKVLETYRDLRKLPTEEAQPKYMAPSLMQGATAP